MGSRYEQQCVVGFGHAQYVVTNTIFFRRDCRPVVAQEVREIRKAVTGCNTNLGGLMDVAAEVPFSDHRDR